MTDTPHMALLRAGGERLLAYLELTKPRIVALVVGIAVASHLIAASGRVEWRRLAVTVLATGLLAAGIFAINHYLERESDGLMRRTRRRPLPAGRVAPAEAVVFGVVLTLGALAFCAAAANLLTAALGVLVAVSYLFVYTPLKRRTTLHVALGAIPGAAPPLMGWAVATGTLDMQVFALAGVVFFWQLPHVRAIQTLYHEDYARGGIQIGKRSPLGLVASLGAVLGASLTPRLWGLGGWVYACGALALGGMYLVAGLSLAIRPGPVRARRLLLASVIYLPALFGLLVLVPG